MLIQQDGARKEKEDFQIGQPGMKKLEIRWNVLMKVFKARLKLKSRRKEP